MLLQNFLLTALHQKMLLSLDRINPTVLLYH